MNLRQLRALVEIHETGSLQDASMRMHVTQSALSKSIKEFETELGVTLLVRSNKGVSLTEGGVRLLTHARQVMESVRRAKQDIDDFKGAAVSEISIGVTPVTALLPFMDEILIRYQTEHPHTRLKVQEMRPATLLQRLRDGQLDFALSSQLPVSTVGFEWHALDRLPSTLLVRKDHPLRNVRSLRLLQHAYWISVDQVSDNQSQLNQLFDGNNLPRPQRLQECTAFSLALLQLAKSDAVMVTCKMPDREAGWILPGIDLRELQIEEPIPEYAINLVCVNRSYLTRSAGSLFDQLLACRR